MDKRNDRFLDQALPLPKQLQFGFSHFRQNKLIHRLPLALFGHIRSAYTDLHPGKALNAEVLGNGADPVMPTGPALAHDLYPASAQVDIIMEHEDVFQRDFEVFDKTPNAFTGTVHVGLRFNKENLRTIGSSLAEQPLQFQRVCPPAMGTGKMIDKEKTDIVPGEMIVSAWITKTDEQKSGIRHEKVRCIKQNEPK